MNVQEETKRRNTCTTYIYSYSTILLFSSSSSSSSPQRVAVTHRNGDVTIECLEKDMGLDLQDEAAVLAMLRGQGIWDAVSFELSG